MAWNEIPLADARLRYHANWLPAARADALLAALRVQIAWETHRIRLFGRWHEAPRRSCWIGDPDASYTYSGTRFAPQPWLPLLSALREPLAHDLGVPFNSVLANWYRDGHDAMGWHSDDEPELGPQPVIASLSLGAERRFLLKRREPGARALGLPLAHGSVLVMAGETQRHYRHAVPRSARVIGERINLTFRWITR
jgi:alkylated DNA repair dioxygenase AlkB